MTDAQQREAARQFYYRWKNKGKEDEDARSYWIELLSDVFGVERVTERVQFEKKLIGAKGSTERIDVYIPETRVIIEQKSLGIPLDKPQAGHDGKTPYEQAKGYDNYLPFSERARWIVLSNFAEIWVYDLDAKKPEPVKILLPEMQDKYHILDFLVNKKQNKITEEVELSKAAGELVGKIRDRFLTQYNDPLAKRTQKSLNVLCVRLVFCFYAEDAGLFGAKDAFSKYILQYKPGDIRGKLLEVFRVLDADPGRRPDMYLDDDLAAFPYVNGGLFSDENIVIPRITQEIKDALAEAARFDWSKISPTIFGAVFESTLNPVTRRKGGMHYTSIENIHKVIDPLFLDDLKAELRAIRDMTIPSQQKKKLEEYQNKLASLVFFDPACGSGNFLTETYLSLRRLENEALRLHVAADKRIMTGQIMFGFENQTPIKVNIGQFYGIEINDFAVAVAKTALWIAEAQMLRETESIVLQEMEFFPLRDYHGITEGNALRIDWAECVPLDRLSYIMGNPPFVGARWMSKEQKEDLINVFGKNWNGAGDLDYVCCWYKLVTDIIKGKMIRAALVSTNSVSQGGAVANLWKPLFDNGVHIDFAYKTFVWDSEASDKAHVHCVIVGFSTYPNNKKKVLYDESGKNEVSNINGYLVDADNVFIEKRMHPISDVPEIALGGQAIDDGNFILTKEEKVELLEKEPQAAPLIRPYMMGRDFINRSPRYCVWLHNANPSIIKKCPSILERVNNVRKFRESSSRISTLKAAERPTLFASILECEEQYVAMPKVSSENRRYIPIDYLSPEIIPGDKLFVMRNSGIYHFGILTSNVHMAWMRTVAGRLKSDYSYSNTIVYNNFPWPSPTEVQKEQIEKTAQGILDARALYPDSSLADLYDPLTMPPELRKAHMANDVAVMKAYGMPIKETDEAACVAWLMKLYQEKVKGLDS